MVAGACTTIRDGCCSPALTLSHLVPCRRTVQDKMTGADIKLTDEQVDLVHRLQKGQFGDVHFNPYEVGSRRTLCACSERCVAPGWAGATQAATATRVCVSPAGR